MRNFLTILFLCIFIILTGCSKKVERPTTLATVQWPGYEPLYLARSLGYLNDSQVNLIENTATTETIEAYRNDTLDMAALTLDEVLLLRQQGKDLKIILVMDISDGADVIVATPSISSMADLKGKRVGVEANALGAYMLGRSLEKSQLAPKDIQIIPLQLGEHESAYHTGRVDALVTFEPVKTKLINAGAKVIFDSSKIPNEILDVLVVKPEYWESHQKEVRFIVQAWFNALEYLHNNKDDAASRMAGRLGLKPEEFLASLNGLKIADRATNLRMLGGNTPELNDNIRRLEKVMLDKSLLNSAVNTENIISSAALE